MVLVLNGYRDKFFNFIGDALRVTLHLMDAFSNQLKRIEVDIAFVA